MLADNDFPGLRIAVVIPCHNEAATVADVIRGFRAALPTAEIYVFDNDSQDATALAAVKAGARVLKEPRRGKGNVVRRIFADIDADIYVMADGDGTYDPSAAPDLVMVLISERADMVVGTRRGITEDAGRRGHAFGNRLFNALYGRFFGNDFTDVFSGYRAFTRRFVKSFPAISSGFEIETEMSVHASLLRIPTAEISLAYGASADSQLSEAARDGLVVALSSAVNCAAYAAALLALRGLDPLPALVFGSATALTASYLGFSRFAFRPPGPAAPRAGPVGS
jgi:glycosyltransferase involved in cell wall biosynthesis